MKVSQLSAEGLLEKAIRDAGCETYNGLIHFIAVARKQFVTDDMTTYRRTYWQNRRERCLENGICPECAVDKTRPGLKSCADCAEAKKSRRRRNLV